MAADRNKNIEIRCAGVRLSYPHLFVPQKSDQPGGKDSYGAALIIPDSKYGDSLVKEIKKGIEDAIYAKWPKDPPSIEDHKKPLKWCDGRHKQEAYRDRYVIGARTYDRPQVIHNIKDPQTGRFRVLEERDGIVYAGCFVNAIIRLYGHDHKARGNFVACSLEAIQFSADGDSFGAPRVNVEDRFSDFEDRSGGGDFGENSSSSRDGWNSGLDDAHGGDRSDGGRDPGREDRSGGRDRDRSVGTDRSPGGRVSTDGGRGGGRNSDSRDRDRESDQRGDRGEAGGEEARGGSRDAYRNERRQDASQSDRDERDDRSGRSVDGDRRPERPKRADSGSTAASDRERSGDRDRRDDRTRRDQFTDTNQDDDDVLT